MEVYIDRYIANLLGVEVTPKEYHCHRVPWQLTNSGPGGSWELVIRADLGDGPEHRYEPIVVDSDTTAKIEKWVQEFGLECLVCGATHLTDKVTCPVCSIVEYDGV